MYSSDFAICFKNIVSTKVLIPGSEICFYHHPSKTRIILIVVVVDDDDEPQPGGLDGYGS